MLWYKSWLETRWRFLIGLALLVLMACAKVFGYPAASSALVHSPGSNPLTALRPTSISGTSTGPPVNLAISCWMTGSRASRSSCGTPRLSSSCRAASQGGPQSLA